MVKKKTKKKHKKKTKKASKKKVKVIKEEDIPTLKLKKEHEIAMDFALKAYKKFEKAIKSIVLFGSTVKQSNVPGSDVDIIIIIDDVSIEWDPELIAWYREELDKILRANPYQKGIHLNTIKLSTWWRDLMKGDPVVLNVLRYGESLIDMAGFFDPLKFLLIKGDIKPTPEAVYNALQRAPMHLQRSRAAEINSVEGLYWCMVDASQAALISANVAPPSPEHIPIDLQETFVSAGMLNKKYVSWYRELLILHKKIVHGEITELKGVEIDDWQARTEEFLDVMIGLVKDIVSS
jgi:predicted nucleotidyltransferase